MLMREHSLIIAGFGGQGIMLAGELIAAAAISEDKNVVWIPSYGAEMRGGTANCTVVISRDQIDSLVVRRPCGAILMNAPSFDKFVSQVKEKGSVVVNSSLVSDDASNGARDDAYLISIPADEIAIDLGSKRAANMVLLGAYIEKTRILTMGNVVESIEKVIPKHRSQLIEIDKRALERGAEYVR